MHQQQEPPQKRVNDAWQGAHGSPKDGGFTERQTDRQREGKGGLLSHCGRVVGNSGSIEVTGRKKQPCKKAEEMDSGHL